MSKITKSAKRLQLRICEYTNDFHHAKIEISARGKSILATTINCEDLPANREEMTAFIRKYQEA